MSSVIPLSNLTDNSINYTTNKPKLKNKEKLDRKQKLIQLLLSSTAHGLPNIVRAENFTFKIMWLLFFISSTCVGSYYVVDSIFDYLKFNTVANVKVVDEMQSQFPTVSFCGKPAFDNVSIDQLILSARFENVYQTNFSRVFEQFSDLTYGKCYRYNSGKNIVDEKIELINATIHGKPNNLRLGFYLNMTEENNFREILFQIHNHSTPPRDMEVGG